MNQIDSAAEEYVLGLARGKLKLEAIGERGAFIIARWLLKTAATFVFSDSKDRRHIPVATLRRIREPNFLPDGYVVFCYQYPTEQRALFAATSDTVIDIDRRVSKRFAKSERLKFGIQYDRFVVGCSYVGCKDAAFIGLPRMHHVLYAASNNFLLDEDLWGVFEKCIQNTPFTRNFLNDFLIGVTFWDESIS